MMRSLLSRLSITLALLAFAAILPARVGAQAYQYLTQWGSAGSGNGQFHWPSGVAVDAAGNVYVADRDDNRIQKFTSAGAYLTQWGSRGSSNGQFQYPIGVAVDASDNVYVMEFGSNLIRRIQKFGLAIVPTKSESWGRLKALYR